MMLDRVFRMAHLFDLIHFHIDYLHFPLSHRQTVPHLTTLHGRLDLPDLQPLYHQFADMPVISISDAQRKPLSQANWQGTVYHGLPPELHRFRARRAATSPSWVESRPRNAPTGPSRSPAPRTFP